MEKLIMMRWIVLALFTLGVQEGAPWRLVFQTFPEEGGLADIRSVKFDGSDVRSFDDEPKYPGGWSPDGKRRLIIIHNGEGSAHVGLFEAESKREHRLTETDGVDESPGWASGGKEIVFGSTRNGRSQVWIMGADGRNPRQLTDDPEGACQPRVGRDRIAFLQKHLDSKTKLPTYTLKTMNLAGGDSKVVLEKTPILGHEWSPGGDRIALSLMHEVRILAMPSGRTEKTFKLTDVHKELASHGADSMLWRPDGASIACNIQHFGGRKAGFTIMGDRQLYVLPLEGKAVQIETGGYSLPIQWIR